MVVYPNSRRDCKSGADLFSELPLPSGKLLRKMLDCHGVPWDALYNVRKGWVRFDDDGFDLEVGGTPAFILPCRDGDKIVDLSRMGRRPVGDVEADAGAGILPRRPRRRLQPCNVFCRRRSPYS